MIWDLYQQFEIDDTKKSAQLNSSEMEIHAASLSAVKSQVDRLTLVCQSMWELLRDQSGLTEEQLYEKILQVDARDGKLDGKIPNEIVTCPHCKVKTNTHKMRCLYCGKGIRSSYPFKA